MKELALGTVLSTGQPFTMPLDEITKATAILGIRDTGKSSLGTVMAEELCKLHQPWIAIEPVGNWWGLRAKPDGSPGGYQIVVFGGERGDLPIEKGDGRKIAEAVISENVCAVIDLKRTSKTLWRIFVRDFVSTLMDLQPTIPRKIFLEEAAEFMPQKASYQLGRECAEIVERLVTLGGNYGYGATILGQRSADIAKTALSQCETVFAFAAQGALDRKAYQDWIKSQKAALSGTMLDELADLPTGTAWCWSPRFLKVFQKVQIRRRETFHPRDARKLGVAIKDVELTPVDEFVTRVRAQLTKVVSAVPGGPAAAGAPKRAAPSTAPNVSSDNTSAAAVHVTGLRAEIADLRTSKASSDVRIQELEHKLKSVQAELRQEQAKVAQMAMTLHAVKINLQPQYDVLKRLFGEISEAPSSSPTNGEISEAWTPWIEKAPSEHYRNVLTTLVKNGRMKKVRLATLSGVQFGGTTWRRIHAWLMKNHLATTDGEEIEKAVL